MSKLCYLSVPAVIVLGAIASSAAAFDGGADELQSYYAGNGFLQRGLYDLAAKEYRVFLRDHADSEKSKTARYGLTVSLFRLGKLDEAAKEAEALGDPKFEFAVETAVIRAQCALAAGRVEEAVAPLRDVLERHGDHKLASEASTLLAEALYRLKRLDEAVATARESLRKWPDGPTAPRTQLLAAQVLFEQGKVGDSAKLLDKLLARGNGGPQASAALFLRGRVWLEEKAYDQAFAAFEKADGESPDLAEETAYWMAKCELRRGQHAAAAKRLAGAIKAHPKGALAAEMAYDRAVALVRCGDSERALGELQGFVKAFADHALAADATELLASTLHQAGKYDQSAKVCEQFMERFADRPQAAAVVFLQAENDFLSQRLDQAAAAYRRFLNSYGKDERADLARFRLGLVLAKSNHPDEALSLLEQAASHSDKDARLAPARLALATARFDRGEWKAAADCFSKYLSTAKDAGDADEALLKLGLCRARQGLNGEALRQFEELISRFPKSLHAPQASFERGQVLMALGKTQEAAVCFEGILSKAAESRFAPYARRHLAAIALKNGDAKRAASLLADVSGKDVPVDLAADAIFERGLALFDCQDYKAAQSAFESFIEKYQAHARIIEARAHRAIALARQKQWEKAGRAIAEIDASKLPGALRASLVYEKAWCLREAGKKDDAAAAYRELMEEPEKGLLRRHAILELAALEQDGKQFKEAAELLGRLCDELKSAEAAEAKEIAPQAAFRLGVCQFELGRFEQAAATLGDYAKRFPSEPSVIEAGYYAGESFFRLGRFEAAIATLDRVIHSEDADLSAAAHLRSGEALAQLQRWPRAEEVFGEYLKRFANREGWHQAMFGVGWARENQGRQDEAMECYRQIIAKHKGPTAARAQFQIGECLFARKKYDEAVRELLKVDILYAYPEWSAAALYEAGRCFEAMNKSAEARDQFRAVAEKYRDSKWASLASQRIAALASVAIPGRASGS